MVDLEYGYGCTRIKALETRLLTRKQWADLFSVFSLPEMTVMLQETSYKDALIRASQKHAGIELLMVGLADNWVQTLRTIERIIPDKAKSALDVLLREWEVQDVKTVCAKKALGQIVSMDELSVATESSRKLCEKLMEQKDWASLLNVLKSSWYGDALRADFTRMQDPAEFRLVSQALDRAYAQQVSEVLKAKAHPNTRALLRLRQEFLHTMIVLRLKPIASSADIEKELFGTPSQKVRDLLGAANLDEAVRLLGLPDSVLAIYHEKNALSAIELGLEKQFVQTALKKFRASVLNFGVVIGFLYLKSAEIANLKRLALGKYFGVEDQFRPFLLQEITGASS
ncbi:V-type ATPase subunit [Candidatus Micrarchaeota archaeon]|nr:V-type ATPase subunit [Candidatus Micrarchaeota archaeon]